MPRIRRRKLSDVQEEPKEEVAARHEKADAPAPLPPCPHCSNEQKDIKRCVVLLLE